MIIIRVELHSAITRRVTEIARMRICNVGGTERRGDYSIETYRGRTAQQLDKREVNRRGEVRSHRRLSLHVWHLVAKALASAGYGEGLS